MPHESDVLSQIRSSYEHHPGFRHWFWDWFAEADLDQELVNEFALAYYQHVLRFRLYVAGALTIAPSESLQVAFAEILADEYGVHLANHPPADSHPEMFRSFMRSLGLSESEWEARTPLNGIAHFFDVHFALFRGGLVSEGLGAVIFGMESTTPHRHGRVLQGLENYQAAHPDTTIDATFFSSHVSIDEHHSDLLYRNAMPWMLRDPEGFARGARYSFDAREVFLDDLGCALGARKPS